MQKFEIDINLEHIAEQRKKWNDATREFGAAVDKALTRLIHEAAAQRLSIQYVAGKAGFTSHQIKSRMKAMGLNPTTGKALLSKQAAAVLESNAEILGIKPHEIDLMSPLAYLPAGPLLKEHTAGVFHIPAELMEGFPETPEPLAEGYWCRSCEFFEMDDLELVGTGEGRMCQACGCDETLHTPVKVAPQPGEVGA